jgi:hypothetical protein
MEMFSIAGYLTYALTSLFAFVSGLSPFLILAGAAAFGGASDRWTHWFEFAFGIWVMVFLVPLILIASRLKFAPLVTIAGSSAMILYCSYCVFIVLQKPSAGTLLVGTATISVWLWIGAAIPFNAINATIAFLRFKDLQNSLR